jgi:Leucine-rich repeat (LRR) protein
VNSIKSANCADQQIGYNNSFNLPLKLNISRHVRILDLSKNHIKILDENTFGDCEGLTELNLHKNHISFVKQLNCSRIKKLDLSWNQLHNLTNESLLTFHLVVS